MHKIYEETEFCWPSVGFEINGLLYYAYYRKEEKYVVLFQGLGGSVSANHEGLPSGPSVNDGSISQVSGLFLPESQVQNSECHNLDGWECIKTIPTTYSEWSAITKNPEIIAINFL
jgi:hypothetical protein